MYKTFPLKKDFPTYEQKLSLLWPKGSQLKRVYYIYLDDIANVLFSVGHKKIDNSSEILMDGNIHKSEALKSEGRTNEHNQKAEY